MAENAEAFRAGKHDGFEPTAWQGLQESIDVIASKGIKVVINGGALNPKGLAEKTYALVRETYPAVFLFSSSRCFSRPTSYDAPNVPVGL